MELQEFPLSARFQGRLGGQLRVGVNVAQGKLLEHDLDIVRISRLERLDGWTHPFAERSLEVLKHDHLHTSPCLP